VARGSPYASLGPGCALAMDRILPEFLFLADLGQRIVRGQVEVTLLIVTADHDAFSLCNYCAIGWLSTLAAWRLVHEGIAERRP